MDNKLPDDETQSLSELYITEFQKIPKENLSFFFTDLMFLCKLAQKEDYNGHFENLDI